MSKNEGAAHPPGSTPLPPEAEEEIMERLFTKMHISSQEIAAILKKHGVCGDMDALQDSYRKRLGQRLMAKIRDADGQREVLSTRGQEYIVVECCNDRQKLQAVRRRIQSQMSGLDVSAQKVNGRIAVLDRLTGRIRKVG